jgi:hypothetical protein
VVESILITLRKVEAKMAQVMATYRTVEKVQVKEIEGLVLTSAVLCDPEYSITLDNSAEIQAAMQIPGVSVVNGTARYRNSKITTMEEANRLMKQIVIAASKGSQSQVICNAGERYIWRFLWFRITRRKPDIFWVYVANDKDRKAAEKIPGVDVHGNSVMFADHYMTTRREAEQLLAKILRNG